MKLVKAIALAAVLALAAVTAPQGADAYTNPITMRGYKMFDAKTGKYFTVKGVDYYPRPNAGELNVNNYDFFTDDHEHIWGPDIENFAALGANAVRLYAVDPTKSHDKFMCALRAKGLYAMIDMGAECEGCHITTDAAPACYSSSMKERGQLIIQAFEKYDNVLAFSAGNEVNNDPSMKNYENAPCQKRCIRDLREYIHKCKLRQIPVGVVMSDRNRMENARYYNCRTDPTDKFETVEWYGINVYLQCDGRVQNYKNLPGFKKLYSDFKELNAAVPMLVTEYGCLNPSFPTENGYEGQRTWLQAALIHSKEFRDVFNGGFIFEYSTELANSKSTSDYPFKSYGPQNYGLGYYTPKNCNHDSVKCTYERMPNFDYLATQYNAVDTSDEVLMADFEVPASRTSPVACPSQIKKLTDFSWSNSTEWLACPATSSFTCPGQESSGSWGQSGSSSLSTEESGDGGDSEEVSPKPGSTDGNNAGEGPSPQTADPKKDAPQPSLAVSNSLGALVALGASVVTLLSALW